MGESTKRKYESKTKGVKDADGRLFCCLSVMLEYYKVTELDYLKRLESGVSLAGTLAEPSKCYNYKVYRDADENCFASLDDMCAIYNIDKYLYLKRRYLKWSVESALSSDGGTNCYGRYISRNREDMVSFNERRREAKAHSDSFISSVDIESLDAMYTKLRREDRKEMLHRKRYGDSYFQCDKFCEGTDGSYRKSCVDFNGKEFPSITEMCSFHGVGIDTFYHRKNSGRTLRECLYSGRLTDLESYKKVIDHTGKVFSTKKEMCEYWGISYGTYCSRVKRGMPLEDALTTSTSSRFAVKDHLGNEFSSINKMCEYYGVKFVTYQQRIHNGWGIEKALTLPAYCKNGVVTDHLGNEYRTITDMCKACGIYCYEYYSRRSNGFSMKDTLEIVVDSLRLPTVDLSGKVYKDCLELCKANKISVSELRKKIKATSSVEEALKNLIKQ